MRAFAAHRALGALASAAVVAACGPLPPPSPERAAEICEDRARAAQGPTGEVRVGVGKECRLEGGFRVGVTSDFLSRRDPLEVYETCYFDLTGTAPIRPPIL